MQSLDLNNPIPRFMGEFYFHVWQYIAKVNNFENFRALDDYIYSGKTLSDCEVAMIGSLYEKHCIDKGIVAALDFIRYLHGSKPSEFAQTLEEHLPYCDIAIDNSVVQKIIDLQTEITKRDDLIAKLEVFIMLESKKRKGLMDAFYQEFKDTDIFLKRQPKK